MQEVSRQFSRVLHLEIEGSKAPDGRPGFIFMLSVGGSLAQLHNGHAHARERAPREPRPDFSLAPSFPNAAHKNALVVVAQEYERNINSYVRYSYNTISRLREAELRE